MNAHIFFADAGLRDDVEKLRMQEYARARGFAVDLTTLKWKQSDDESHVMVARNDGRLVSTMRGEIIDSLTLLEKKLECPWDYPVKLDMPVLLLSRAATCSSQRSSGLNLVLRYWFFRMARAKGVRYVVGTFVAGSPRENSLRAMGYSFFSNPLGWQQSTYRSLGEVRVVVLDLEKRGAQALRYCEERAPAAIAQYQFEGGFPELRTVRTV